MVENSPSLPSLLALSVLLQLPVSSSWVLGLSEFTFLDQGGSSDFKKNGSPGSE